MIVYTDIYLVTAGYNSDADDDREQEFHSHAEAMAAFQAKLNEGKYAKLWRKTQLCFGDGE